MGLGGGAHVGSLEAVARPSHFLPKLPSRPGLRHLRQDRGRTRCALHRSLLPRHLYFNLAIFRDQKGFLHTFLSHLV